VDGLDELQSEDPRRIGPYRLEERLGSGGMGRVFLGRSPGGRRVAIKVIRPFGHGTTVALLYRVVSSQPNTAGLPGGLRLLAERCLAKDRASGRQRLSCWPG
jgi:hypothetical protein